MAYGARPLKTPNVCRSDHRRGRVLARYAKRVRFLSGFHRRIFLGTFTCQRPGEYCDVDFALIIKIDCLNAPIASILPVLKAFPFHEISSIPEENPTTSQKPFPYPFQGSGYCPATA